MNRILEQANNFTHLEREALYKAVGGIQLSKVAAFREHQKIQAGNIGHIVVDQKSAIGIFSGFDLQLANLLLDQEKSIVK